MQGKAKLIKFSAMECIAETGLQNSTTSQIAKRAGVGEGTIYRYFRNKDELIEKTAYFAEIIISSSLMKDYDKTESLFQQYIHLCESFLKNGLENPTPLLFMEQFRNSPMGIDFKKQRVREVSADPTAMPFFYPLSLIIHNAIKKGIVKEYPFQLLASLTIGPLIFVLKDGIEGVLHIDEKVMSNVAHACWDSIRI